MVFYPENIIVYSKSSKNSFHSLYASGGEGRNIYYICKTVKPGARGSFLYLASQTETEFGVSLSCLMVSCNFSLQTVGPLVLSIPGPRDLVDLKSHNPNLLALPIGTQDPGRDHNMVTMGGHKLVNSCLIDGYLGCLQSLAL